MIYNSYDNGLIQGEMQMRFLINLLINLGGLLFLGLVLFLLFPDLMSQVFQVYGKLLGPGLMILLLVVAALPRRRRY